MAPLDNNELNTVVHRNNHGKLILSFWPEQNLDHQKEVHCLLQGFRQLFIWVKETLSTPIGDTDNLY